MYTQGTNGVHTGNRGVGTHSTVRNMVSVALAHTVSSQEKDNEHKVLTRSTCSMLQTIQCRQQWWISVVCTGETTQQWWVTVGKPLSLTVLD